MFSDEEKREIDEELAQCPQKRAAVSEALKIVQRHRGWVADEGVADVADYLGISAAAVDGVATFYSVIRRRPAGRHVILICDGVSCYIMGYDSLREHLSRRLGLAPGDTTGDGRFTLLPNACLGACEHAPAMMIDDDFHGDLTAEKIDLVLEQYE
jgi:NADH-quinone oxidoreductase subunit E